MKKARLCSICAMCTALYAVCAWICVPTTPPVTLQSFAVFTVAGLFGCKTALTSYIIYLSAGVLGLPVFSAFSGGIAVLAGPTGGYLLGFLGSVLISSLILRLFGRSAVSIAVSFAAGLLVLYIFATVYYSLVILSGSTFHSIAASLSVCVVPFVLPDIAKLSLAVLTVKRLEGRFKNI